MTYDPEAAQQAAREQLSGVAAGVAGQDVAGVYGDPAGASVHDAPQSEQQVAENLVAQGARPAAPDVDALIAAVQAQAEQLRALQEQINARAEAEKVADASPPSLLDVIGSSVLGSQVAHAFSIVEERLAALEAKS